MWDRWDYSRDPALLARIYPVMRDCGLFFLDTLVQAADGSGLVTSPHLARNAHHPGVSICEGPAMDRQILRELFANISAATAMLGRDADLARQFDAARARIPADRVGRAGQLQEWMDDWDMDVPEIQHRHVSHLFALHPGHEIGAETPAMLAAARRSLSIRGDDATGWALAGASIYGPGGRWRPRASGPEKNCWARNAAIPICSMPTRPFRLTAI